MTSVSCTPGHPLTPPPSCCSPHSDKRRLGLACCGPLAFQAAASLTQGPKYRWYRFPWSSPKARGAPCRPASDGQGTPGCPTSPVHPGVAHLGLPEAPSTQGSEAPCEALPPPSLPHSSIVRSAPSAEPRPEVCGGPGAGHGRLSPARLLPSRWPPRPRVSVPFAHPCCRCGPPSPARTIQAQGPQGQGSGVSHWQVTRAPWLPGPCLCSRNLLRVQPWPQPRGPHRPAGGSGGHQR